MRDETIITEPGLSSAEAAVSYLLQRIRLDADLRYHMVGTEAFSRLCAAEAERAGEAASLVISEFSTAAPHRRDEVPALLHCQRLLDQIAVIVAGGDSSVDRLIYQIAAGHP